MRSRAGDRLRAWRRWQAAAGPWRGWAICPALIARGPREFLAEPARTLAAGAMRNDRRRAYDLAAQLLPSFERGGVLCTVSLDPRLGIPIAAHLNARGIAHAVLVLQRWPYRDAILEVGAMLGALLDSAAGLRLDGARLPNVVFVLDAERNPPVPDRPLSDHRADNRYDLHLYDLPSLATLRARGIQRILSIAHVAG